MRMIAIAERHLRTCEQLSMLSVVDVCCGSGQLVKAKVQYAHTMMYATHYTNTITVDTWEGVRQLPPWLYVRNMRLANSATNTVYGDRLPGHSSCTSSTRSLNVDTVPYRNASGAKTQHELGRKVRMNFLGLEAEEDPID